MLKFDGATIRNAGYDVIFEDAANAEVKEALEYAFAQLEGGKYSDREIDTAVQGTQATMEIEDEQPERFKKLKRARLWEAAIVMGFIDGLSYAEKCHLKEVKKQ